MKCQGRPEDGRCPDSRNDDTVHNTIGDLFLCKACEEYRWPAVGATAKLSIPGASISRKHNTRQNAKPTTEKSNIKKAPSNNRAQAVNTPHSGRNNGHDSVSQVPQSSSPSCTQEIGRNDTFMNDDDYQTTATSCSACMMSSNDDDISCDICKAVYHIKCLPVPPKLLDCLSTLISTLGWVCDTCRVSARNEFQKLHSAVSSLTQEIASLQLQLKHIPASPETGNNDSSAFEASAEAKAKITTEHTRDTNVCIVVHKTLEDLKQRKSNVVVTGLPETDEVDSDRDLFVNFCSEHLSIKPHVSECARLGKNITDQPRRLLIKLTNEQSAEELLKDARKLRSSPDAFANTVFLNPDLSPQQRQLAFEARCRRRQKKRTSEQKKVSVTTEIEVLHASPNQPSTTATTTNTTTAGIDQHPTNSTSSDTDQRFNQADPTTDTGRFQSV